VVIAFHVNTLS